MTADHSEHNHVRQAQAAATRLHLLQAAGAVFEVKGYRATTVRAITDQADTAHGTFYLYFRNKEDAFCRVIETVIVDEFSLTALTPADGPPRKTIEQSVRKIVAVYHSHAGLWRAVYEGMLQSARVQALWLQLRHDIVLSGSNNLDVQQRAGRVRPFDSVMVAHALAAMIEWSAFTHLVLGEPRPEAELDPEALVGTLSELWYRSVYGVVPDD